MSTTTKDLQDLLDQIEGPCVSLYMPTHPAGPEIRQDPIRLKNLLKETEQQLTEQGIRSTDARTWLEPLSKLVEDEQFWRHQDQGLAMYLAKDWHRLFRLPLSLSRARYGEIPLLSEAHPARVHVWRNVLPSCAQSEPY